MPTLVYFCSGIQDILTKVLTRLCYIGNVGINTRSWISFIKNINKTNFVITKYYYKNKNSSNNDSRRQAETIRTSSDT